LASAGFRFADKLLDRLRGGYARRRADYLHLCEGAWTAQQIAAQIVAEFAVIVAYIKTKDPIVNDTDAVYPPHLNLAAQASLTLMNRSADLPRFAKALADEVRLNRQHLIQVIVWRALAIHSDKLWRDLGPPPVIQLPALNELLDRRLRAVEQMHFNVNSAGLTDQNRQWTVRNAKGPCEEPQARVPARRYR